MADKPSVVRITARARPSEATIRLPPAFTNTVAAVSDPSGLTVTFFYVPAEIVGLPEAQAVFAKTPPRPGEVTEVPITLEALAKVWLPGDLIPEVLRVLGEEYSKFLTQKALRDEETRNAAH